jgi:WD40 repeat protein
MENVPNNNPNNRSRFEPWSIAFSADGELLAIGSFGGKGVKIFDVQTSSERKGFEWPSGVYDLVDCLAFAPDGVTVWLAIATASTSYLSWWKWQSDDFPLRGPFIGSTTLAIERDGKRLIAGDKLFDLASAAPHEIGSFQSDKTYAFSPDSSLVATVSGNAIRIWSVTNLNSPVKTLSGHSADVTSVQFFPDEDIIVSGSADYSVRLWNLSTGKVKGAWFHQARVTCVAISGNGKWVASGSIDGKLKFWNRALAREYAEFEIYGRVNCGIAFSPDSSLLAAVRLRPNEVKIWKLSL